MNVIICNNYNISIHAEKRIGIQQIPTDPCKCNE